MKIFEKKNGDIHLKNSHFSTTKVSMKEIEKWSVHKEDNGAFYLEFKLNTGYRQHFNLTFRKKDIIELIKQISLCTNFLPRLFINETLFELEKQSECMEVTLDNIERLLYIMLAEIDFFDRIDRSFTHNIEINF